MRRPPLTDIQTDNNSGAPSQNFPTVPKSLDAPAIHFAPFVNNLGPHHMSIPEQLPTLILTRTISTEKPVSIAAPINSPDYFESSIETLLHSAARDSDISLHDLADAYAVLSTRIRFQSQEIVKTQSFSALGPLKDHSNAIHQCLLRDTKQALVDSFSDKRPSSNKSTPSDLATITEEQVEYARDQSVLCHSALRLACDLFRFPALYSIFSTNDLTSLLDSVLTIALSPSLPTPNYRKTWALAVGILCSQTLPSTIIVSRKQEITDVIERAIKGKYGKDTDGITGDGLKAVHNLLRHHSSNLQPHLARLLPRVLLYLISESHDLRLSAAFALSGFAIGKIDCEMSGSTRDISHHVRSFIDSQSSKHKSVQTKARLPDIIMSALTANNPSHLNEGPKWAISVISSMIILLDASLFSHPRSLKLILPSLAQTLVHQRHFIQSLQPSAWKLLVWAFSRITLESRVAGDDDPPIPDTAEPAFLIVKQELGGGIGSALISALLGSADNDDMYFKPVAKALGVIEEMVWGSCISKQNEGLSTLTCLLRSFGTSAKESQKWDRNSILDRALVDGSILQAKWDRPQTAITTSGEFKFDGVRQLSEGEIVQHWDTLLAIWIKGIYLILADRRPISHDLINAWQSLLLAQAHLTQGHSHLTAPPILSSRIPAVVSGFLDPDPTGTAIMQHQQLSLTMQLWNVMKNVFAAPWLSSPSGSVLATVVKRDWLLGDEAVESIWNEFCTSLISTGVSSVSGIFCMPDEHQVDVKVRRELWTMFAKDWQMSRDGKNWQDGATLVIVPFGAWVLTDEQIRLCDSLVRSVILSAKAASTAPVEVIQYAFRQLEKKTTQQLVSNLGVICILVSCIDLSDSEVLPAEIFPTINRVLGSLYPPPPELFATALHMLDLLRGIINSATLCIIPILTTLRTSLCRWIEDESEILLAEEFNRVVIPLYCDLLVILRNLPPSSETLDAIAPFLVAVFVHIPPPALGPMAFETFWRSTYHNVNKLEVIYPGRIKVCLKGFDDAFGGDLSVGLSLDSDSQHTPSWIVSDSQSSRWMPPSNFEGNATGFDDKDAPDVERRLGASFPTAQPDILCHPDATGATPSAPRQSPVAPLPAHLVSLHSLQYYASPVDASTECKSPPPHRPPEVIGVAPLTAQLLTQQSAHYDEVPSPPAQPTPDIMKSASFSRNKKRKANTMKLPLKHQKTGLEYGHKSPARGSSAQPASISTGHRNLTVSEPITRVTSPIRQPQSRSRPRMWLDYVEVPTLREVLECERRRPLARIPQLRQRWSPSQKSTMRPPRTGPSFSSSDTSNWEAALLTPDTRRTQREVESDNFVPDSQMESPKFSDFVSQNRVLAVIESPSQQTQRGERSQTAPAPLSPTSPLPLRRTKTTAGRLEVLHQAFTVLNTDGSQMPMGDLLQATRLVNQIGTVLNEKMSRKLRDPE